MFPRVYANCSGCAREDAVVKVKGRVERKEGIPRIVALEMEELHLEPGLDPVYLDAGAFVGLSRAEVDRAFDILCRHSGGSSLFLVSEDGALEERICGVDDSSDLHAELKQLLGTRCISAVRPAVPEEGSEPEMERVS